MSPFLLISYIYILMAMTMLVRGNTGFGLVYIEVVIILSLCFVMSDFGLKRVLKKI